MPSVTVSLDEGNNIAVGDFEGAEIGFGWRVMVPSVMVSLDQGNIIAFGDLKEQKLALAEE